MAISDSLTIIKTSDTKNTFCFDCAGSIDVNAKVPLESLSDVPAKAHVVLEFKKIERVNSMGLSLLLKIFEEWEKKQITVEVKDLNRMVNMLFKITGLGRFVAGNTDAKTGDKKTISPQAPIHANAKKDGIGITEKLTVKKKLNFVASLQTGQQLTGWYLFNTYLQRRMQKAIHFDQAQDMLNEASVDILFAKPFEACAMIKKRGFIPIMRPIAEADEVVILTRADDDRTLEDFKGASVVTASENSFVYILGRFLCDENEVDSTTFNFTFSGNEIKSLQMLIRKKADLLFMLKKTYEGLSSFSKKNVRKLDESATDFAFHLFSIAPNLKEEGKTLHTILAEMADDEKGKRILEDIEFQGWCPVEEGELKMLTMVFDRYVTDG
ncbi:MAG: PhnD/SsuA/transferrin family substrate-binding protein [Methyloprofundus sp.]|nr:PhnD/SsuA/transferrin family substrate-binding protein [Methyloprofundus sp.]